MAQKNNWRKKKRTITNKKICPVEFERINVRTKMRKKKKKKYVCDRQGRKSACELNSLKWWAKPEIVIQKSPLKRERKKWQTEEMWWKIVELWKPQAHTLTPSLSSCTNIRLAFSCFLFCLFAFICLHLLALPCLDHYDLKRSGSWWVLREKKNCEQRM